MEHAFPGVPATQAMTDAAQDSPGVVVERRLRLISFNIQAGTTTANYRDYVTKGWRQVLPHQQRIQNLDQIARLVADFDIAALQEVDDGSLRTGFLNQTQFLAERAGFPFWSHQSNRRVSKLARTCNGVLSRIRPREVHDHKLPGRIPGRGALAVHYGNGSTSLLVVNVHLALGRRSRRVQLDFLHQLTEAHEHVIMVGDLNASGDSPEVVDFLERSQLRLASQDLLTFPSWRPQRAIDHVFVSSELTVSRCLALDVPLSDHLPVAMEIELPYPLAKVDPSAAAEEHDGNDH